MDDDHSGADQPATDVAVTAAPVGFDPTLHPIKRLRIASLLAARGSMTAADLRTELGLQKADLSKQMRALLDAGYVQLRRTGAGPGSETWYRLTRDGRAAVGRHREALLFVLDPTLPRNRD